MTRNILVTGAASGIGKALCHLLEKEGAAVYAVDRSFEPGQFRHSMVCDLTDPAAISNLPAELPELHGIASVAGVPGTLPAVDVLAVNFLAPKLLVKNLLQQVVPGSALVNVSSVAAARNIVPADQVLALQEVEDIDDIRRWLSANPVSDAQSYDTSKRALTDWTARLAATLLPHEIRAVSVSPGPVQTPILADFTTSMGADAIDRSAAIVGRHGRPEEIASVIAFALSPDSSWVNGIDLCADGGLTAARQAIPLNLHYGARL